MLFSSFLDRSGLHLILLLLCLFDITLSEASITSPRVSQYSVFEKKQSNLPKFISKNSMIAVGAKKTCKGTRLALVIGELKEQLIPTLM